MDLNLRFECERISHTVTKGTVHNKSLLNGNKYSTMLFYVKFANLVSVYVVIDIPLMTDSFVFGLRDTGIILQKHVCVKLMFKRKQVLLHH